MNRQQLGLSLLFGLLFLALTAYAEVAAGQATDTPESLVLRFDESAASLDQVSIRATIAQELAMTLANNGSDQAATLIVSMTPNGEVQLSYRPAREVLTRSIAVTTTSNVPQLVAHLAGNLVRDESSALIAELQPPPSATDSTTTNSAVHNAATGDAAPIYLDNAWIFSVLGGGGMSLADDDPAFGNLVFQFSKRIGRLELGAGARFAYGNMDIVARSVGPEEGIFANSNVAIGYQVTLPISAEYRVLGGQNAYLQLGVATGLRMSGFMNQSASITSGSDAYLMLGVQATTGFALARNHGVMLRVGWDILPVSHHVSDSDGEYELAPLPFGVQLGWQIGW